MEAAAKRIVWFAARRGQLTVIGVMAIAGVIYPLVGLSMLAAVIFERLYELARRVLERRASLVQ